MTTDRFTLSLQETSAPPGEIALADLAAIGAHLQDLATRVGRWVGHIERPGRSTSSVEEAVALRLSGLKAGSTVLEVTRGPSRYLDFDVPFEEAFDERLWQTIVAIGHDAPPEDAPAGVRESAVGLLDALKHAARKVEVARPSGASVTFRPAERDRGAWAVAGRAVEEGTVSVTGVVEMADLRSHKYRLRDDVGNAIPLEGVGDPSSTARLLGERADAVGRPVRDTHGRLVAVSAPTLRAATVAASWTVPVQDEAWKDVALPGPDPDGGVEFSDDEWDGFLAALRGE